MAHNLPARDDNGHEPIPQQHDGEADDGRDDDDEQQNNDRDTDDFDECIHVSFYCLLLMFYRKAWMDIVTSSIHDYSCQPLAQGRINVAPYTSDCQCSAAEA